MAVLPHLIWPHRRHSVGHLPISESTLAIGRLVIRVRQRSFTAVEILWMIGLTAPGIAGWRMVLVALLQQSQLGALLKFI